MATFYTSAIDVTVNDGFWNGACIKPFFWQIWSHKEIVCMAEWENVLVPYAVGIPVYMAQVFS